MPGGLGDGDPDDGRDERGKRDVKQVTMMNVQRDGDVMANGSWM